MDRGLNFAQVILEETCLPILIFTYAPHPIIHLKEIFKFQVNVSELGLVTQGGKVVWGKPLVMLHHL